MTTKPAGYASKEVRPMSEQVELAGELALDVTNPSMVFFDLPEWYYQLTGRVSVMTPYATDIVFGKSKGSIAPFSEKFPMVARHYAWPEEMTYDEIRHEDLAPDKIRFKPWGEEERIYRVNVVEEMPDVEGTFGGDAGGE